MTNPFDEAIDELHSVQFIDNTYKEGVEAEKQCVDILRKLNAHYENILLPLAWAKWIPTSKILPVGYVEVIVVMRFEGGLGIPRSGYYNPVYSTWHLTSGYKIDQPVVFWMSLPPRPQESKQP